MAKMKCVWACSSTSKDGNKIEKAYYCIKRKCKGSFDTEKRAKEFCEHFLSVEEVKKEPLNS